jgi:hypothetical protein
LAGGLGKPARRLAGLAPPLHLDLARQEARRRSEPEHYVDFHDCAYARFAKAVCTGITEYTGPTGARFELGGIGLVDLDSATLGAEVPVQTYSAAGHVVTRNPVAIEVDGDTLRMYGAPDDGEGGCGNRAARAGGPRRVRRFGVGRPQGYGRASYLPMLCGPSEQQEASSLGV